MRGLTELHVRTEDVELRLLPAPGGGLGWPPAEAEGPELSLLLPGPETTILDC